MGRWRAVDSWHAVDRWRAVPLARRPTERIRISQQFPNLATSRRTISPAQTVACTSVNHQEPYSDTPLVVLSSGVCEGGAHKHAYADRKSQDTN